MCFNSGMAIDWCIKCGSKTKNMSFCQAFNELMMDDDDDVEQLRDTNLKFQQNQIKQKSH